MTDASTYTLTNDQTSEIVARLTAQDFALWSNARLLLAIAKSTLPDLRGQEYLQVAAVIAQAEGTS